MKKSYLTLFLILAVVGRIQGQTVRQWSGSSSGAWFTTTNWTPSGTYAGVATATVAGGGAATDIMSVVATNTATNVGLNMNSATAGAGGLGLTVAAIDWNKTNGTATTIGNSSTIVGGVLRLGGATLNAVDNTVIRVAGSGNLTLANANTGTATAAQTLGLELGSNSVFQVDPARILTLSVSNITESAVDGAFSLQGGGQLVINAPNALTGLVSVVAGRLQAGNPTAFGSGPVTVAAGSQVYLTTGVGNQFTIAGNGWLETVGSLGALRYQGATTTGAITVSAAARVGAYNGATGTLSGPLLGNQPLEINGSDTNLNGTINLNGNASGFSGPLTVSQGRLNLNTTAGPTGPVTVADGATLGGEGSMSQNLTLGTTTGATLQVNVTTLQVLTVAGNITVNGVLTVVPSGTNPTPIRVLKSQGTLNATPANFELPGGLASYRPGTAFDTTTVPGEVQLTIAAMDVLWTGANSGNWNNTEANWNSPDSKFYSLDRVTFDDSSTVNAVTLPASVTPAKVTVNNTSNDYGMTGSGGITGGATLVKKGKGKLSLGNPNTYTGGTEIQGGMVEVATVDALPAGIVISQGTLRVVPVLGLAAAKTITLGDANTTLGERQVVDIPSAASSDQVVLSTPIILAPGVLGKAVMTYSGVTASGGSPQYNGPVTLNGRDLWLENTSDTGGNTTRLWNMYGKISGAGNVHVDVPSAAARVRIGFNGNDFTGDIYIDRGMLQNGTGSGTAQNAIPNSSNVIMAAGTRFGVGASDTMGALVGGAADPANALAAANVAANISSGSVTLTIGSGDRSGSFSGTVTDASSTIKLILTKSGIGTQTLNGDCAFTGATTLSAGKLLINAAFASAITISGGATLGGNGTSIAAITATSTANGGANVAPGNGIGTLTAASANLSTGGNLLIDIDDNATPKNDKLAVTGALNITNARLVVTGTGTQAAYIIASYGTLTGTFLNPPAGFTVDYAYNDGASTNNIALLPLSDPYIAWAASKGLTAGNNDKAADPDADGVPNGLEFYLNGDPLRNDTPGITPSLSGANLRLTYKRRDDAESLNVTSQTSISMAAGTWTTLQNGVNGVVINITENDADPDDVEILIPLGSEVHRFARLLLVLP